MGLTAGSTGFAVSETTFEIHRKSENDRVIAIAGNPNVGKSTLFNNLTGLHQHTGNWPGKTVASAQGYCSFGERGYVLVDIPGTYSLMAHSAEEEVARNFICFGGAEAAVVVCDATCLQRSMNLVLQVMELCPKTLVCVNLMDEAKRRKIKVDLKRLEDNLGVPVVGTQARKKRSLGELMERLEALCAHEAPQNPRRLRYTKPIEEAISALEPTVSGYFGGEINPRWLALRLLENDKTLTKEMGEYLSADLTESIERGKRILAEAGITSDSLKDRIVSCILLNAEEVCDGVVESAPESCSADRRADRFLTGRVLGYPIMLLMLILIFWITIVGANYPSEWLSTALFALGDKLRELMELINAPQWLTGLLTDGVYRVLAWVVSVMLPPMAIFFPLFTLLEDSGYLPRIAYNLDKPFHKCSACGKQALTMCMGYIILQSRYLITKHFVGHLQAL